MFEDIIDPDKIHSHLSCKCRPQNDDHHLFARWSTSDEDGLASSRSQTCNNFWRCLGLNNYNRVSSKGSIRVTMRDL